MYHYLRIYDFHGSDMPTILADRLWPRGISKARLTGVTWSKDLTPSADLRRWYHQNPEQRFDEFVTRYQQELANPCQQASLQQVRDSHDKASELLLLTAAKDVEHSHIPVLIATLQNEVIHDDH